MSRRTTSDGTQYTVRVIPDLVQTGAKDNPHDAESDNSPKPTSASTERPMSDGQADGMIKALHRNSEALDGLRGVVEDLHGVLEGLTGKLQSSQDIQEEVD